MFTNQPLFYVGSWNLEKSSIPNEIPKIGFYIGRKSLNSGTYLIFQPLHSTIYLFFRCVVQYQLSEIKHRASEQ
jgi:hypothetical protein